MRAVLLLLAAAAAATAADWIPLDVSTLDIPVTNQHGETKTFHAGYVQDRAYVIGFFFTNCNGICPRITAAMAALRRRLSAADAQMLSISVDPAQDRPPVLRAYAATYRAAWPLLTGSPRNVQRLLRALGTSAPEPSLHTNQLLVGCATRRRATWISAFVDPPKIERLVRSACAPD
jgi:cytochrome oxidase Cu insertion factor (SCO1/SenC/PrrC family)